MAKQKVPSPSRNYLTLLLCIIILVGIYFLAKVTAANNDLTKENQAMKVYLQKTTGWGDATTPVFNVKITDQNKTYQNKFLGISYEMPVGWYYETFYNIDYIFKNPTGAGGFMGLRNKVDPDHSGTEKNMQKGDYQLTFEAGYMKPTYNAQNAEHVVIGGVPAVKVTRSYNMKFENTQTVRKFVQKTYYVTYRSFNFEFQAISPADGNPSFKEFDRLMQTMKFAK